MKSHLAWLHSTHHIETSGGYECHLVLHRHLYWPGMPAEMKNFISSCSIYVSIQAVKTTTPFIWSAKEMLGQSKRISLHPPWKIISSSFITGLTTLSLFSSRIHIPLLLLHESSLNSVGLESLTHLCQTMPLNLFWMNARNLYHYRSLSMIPIHLSTVKWEKCS